MPRCLYYLLLGTYPILVGCFNPTGQSTDGTGATSTGTTTGTGATSTTASTGAPTTSDTTTGPVSTSDPSTGDLCPSCPEGTPYCVDGQCISCVDLPAHGQNCDIDGVDTPYCDAASGKCVECLGDEECGGFGVCHDTLGQCVQCQNGDGCEFLQICDEETSTCVDCLGNHDCPGAQPICEASECRRCQEHSECGTGACDLKDGPCFPDTTVPLYVDDDTCGGMACTIDLPCCQISDAMAVLSGGRSSHYIVHVKPGNYGPFVFNSPNKHVAVLAEPGALVTGIDPLTPAIKFLDAFQTSELYIAGLQVTGGSSAGFDCEGGIHAGLDDVRFTDLSNLAGEFVQCSVTIRRSEFLRCGGGFVVNQAANLRLENSIIAGMTAGKSALRLPSDGMIEVLYSTIALQPTFDGGFLSCAGGSTVIRNSALLAAIAGDSKFVQCPFLALSDSVTSESSLMGAPGVQVVLPALVKEPFVDWDNFELRLDSGPSFLDEVAQWMPGDPRTDIDGDARPKGPDNKDVAGADQRGP